MVDVIGGSSTLSVAGTDRQRLKGVSVMSMATSIVRPRRFTRWQVTVATGGNGAYAGRLWIDGKVYATTDCIYADRDDAQSAAESMLEGLLFNEKLAFQV